MPHLDWNAILSVVVAIAAAVLRHAIVTPKDAELAAQIRHVADDVAAVIHTSFPASTWADKVEAIVDRLDSILPDLPPTVVERAAQGALARLGVRDEVIASTNASGETKTP